MLHGSESINPTQVEIRIKFLHQMHMNHQTDMIRSNLLTLLQRNKRIAENMRIIFIVKVSDCRNPFSVFMPLIIYLVELAMSSLAQNKRIKLVVTWCVCVKRGGGG